MSWNSYEPIPHVRKVSLWQYLGEVPISQSTTRLCPSLLSLLGAEHRGSKHAAHTACAASSQVGTVNSSKASFVLFLLLWRERRFCKCFGINCRNGMLRGRVGADWVLLQEPTAVLEGLGDMCPPVVIACPFHPVAISAPTFLQTAFGLKP